ncbi:MAG: peptidoglycan-binding protein [Rhodobacterales bacterium]|nr:MAG: peptidoglycan-binding protein [Rhodobacterales bacterium]
MRQIPTDWRRIQRRLAELGFDPGPIDGLRGPRTDAAVVAFKRSIGLRPRPYVGPLTLAALFEAGPAALISKGGTELPWMIAAQDVRGLHEARDTALLSHWFDRSLSWIDPREVAWCGAFVATCHKIADPGIALPDNPLGARNWLAFGRSCSPVFGATLVFWRGKRTGWKGHVGFYTGEDATHYHVLGGNQSNAVTVTRVAKRRLLAARWPDGVDVTGRKILLNAKGVPITGNEA